MVISYIIGNVKAFKLGLLNYMVRCMDILGPEMTNFTTYNILSKYSLEILYRVSS